MRGTRIALMRLFAALLAWNAASIVLGGEGVHLQPNGRRHLSFHLRVKHRTKAIITRSRNLDRQRHVPAAGGVPPGAYDSPKERTGGEKQDGDPDIKAPRSGGKPHRAKLKHPQQCLCPRSLLHVISAMKKLGNNMTSRVTEESMNYPLCSFDTAGIEEEMRGDMVEEDILRKLQHEFYRSVRAVCPVRKKVILHRRESHCSFLAELVYKNHEDRYLKGHFDQVYVDKSRHCSNDRAQVKSSSTLNTQIYQPRLERLELDMVRRRALVESVPTVLVVQAVRHLIWHEAGIGGLIYRRGQEAAVMEGLEREARIKDPEFVSKRVMYVDKAMAYMPQEPPQELIQRRRSCAVVGNAGILKLRKQGRAIDAHSLVIRLNQGPDGRPESGPGARRFRDHVGTRTDMRMLNRKWTELYASRYSKLLERDPPGVTYLASRSDVKYIAMLGDQLSNSTEASRKFLWMNDKLVSQGSVLLRAAREGIQEGLGIRFTGGSSPSSGFMALHAALHMCDKVTAYGFTIGNCYGFCKKPRMYHYFSSDDAPDRSNSWNHEAHSFGLEGHVLKAMHVLGILCIDPPPMGLGACGSRLDGALDKIGLLSEAAENQRAVDFDALLRNRTLFERLGPGTSGRRGAMVMSQSITPGLQGPGSDRRQPLGPRHRRPVAKPSAVRDLGDSGTSKRSFGGEVLR